MSGKTYTPEPGSVAWKVIAFFTENPGETLTPVDIGIKFDKPAKQVHSILAMAVESGALRRGEGADGELVYRLGTGHPSITPGMPTGPKALHDLQPWGASVPGARKRRAPVVLDLTAVTIEKSVPLPSAQAKHANDWPALFDRMAVGDSVTLPLAARGAVTKAAQPYGARTSRKFAVRRIDDDTLRLWRTA